MTEKRTSIMAIWASCLTALLAFSPAVIFAEDTTTFRREAVALKANAPGVTFALGDTGALPSSGGKLSTSLASASVTGIASADTLSSSTSGSGSSSQSQSTLQDVNLLNGLVAATAVKSNSSASCSNGQASTSGNAQLVGLTVAGQSILVSARAFRFLCPAESASSSISRRVRLVERADR